MSFLRFSFGKTKIHNSEITKDVDQGHLSRFEPQNQNVCLSFSCVEVLLYSLKIIT